MLSETRIATSEPAGGIGGQSVNGNAKSPTIPKTGQASFRPPPHNLEAEQALLGAILVNNEAMDRVSSFLEPQHFFDPLHQQIFDTCSEFIAAGKLANPITFRTFFENAEPISSGLTVPQYLGTLAANATTIINMEDYGRTVYDLATRRALIVRCEDAMDVAYDSPVDAPVKEQLDKLHDHIGNLLCSCGRDALHISRCLADIDAEPIRWLWPNRFALGKLALVAGAPGLGKSQLMCAMAAAVTTGGTWPDGTDAPLGSVILVSCEDDAADTIRPRLEAAGADLSHVHLFDWALCRGETGVREQKHLDVKTHGPALKELIDQVEGVQLIIIDPITAYMGRADSHKTAEVRGALIPLPALAAETGTAIILVSHLNKNETNSAAMDRVVGSGAYVAVCRSAWLVASDPEDEAKRRRILTPLKNNLGDDQTGFAFTIEGAQLSDGITTSNVVFDPIPLYVAADDLLRSAKQGASKAPSKCDRACQFLQQELADGPKLTKDVAKAAAEAGIAHDTIKRARGKLKIVAQKEMGKENGSWILYLPEHVAEKAEKAEAADQIGTGPDQPICCCDPDLG